MVPSREGARRWRCEYEDRVWDVEAVLVDSAFGGGEGDEGDEVVMGGVGGVGGVSVVGREENVNRDFGLSFARRPASRASSSLTCW